MLGGARPSNSQRARAESRVWKTLTDAIGGGVLLAVAAVPMIVISAAILLDSGRPVLLRQRRIGRDGREFGMWKFRTLPKDSPQLAKSELDTLTMRVTALGRFMRRYSIDELPQLLNVLTGEMSLVGPRPALFTQRDLVSMRTLAGAMEVKPGLTGLAQVSGREDLTLEQKVALDAEYARHVSPSRDLAILIRTIPAVTRARGSR